MKPTALPPTDSPTPTAQTLPAGACDAHVHMVAIDDRFPLWEGRVEDPATGDFDYWLAKLREHLAALGFTRTVIVHSIFYGGDNALTLASVKALGRDRAAGIGLVRDGATDAELDVLAEGGVAGVRLNYVHGGLLTWEGALALAPRLKERGMHIQMLLHTHAHMAEIADDVRRVGVPIVFDHIGWPDLARGVGDPGFQSLCALLAEGKAWAKLSAPYRLTPYDEDTSPFLKALLAANTERCLWGSDWPHIMLADAKQPDAGALLNRALAAMDDATIRRVFVDGPEQLYGFPR